MHITVDFGYYRSDSKRAPCFAIKVDGRVVALRNTSDDAAQFISENL